MHRLAGGLRGRGPVDPDAVCLQLRLDRRQVGVEVLDDVLLDLARERPQAVRVGVVVEEELRALLVADLRALVDGGARLGAEPRRELVDRLRLHAAVLSGVAQHLGKVQRPDGVALPRRQAREVHEAAHVPGDQDVGLGGAHVLQLQVAHRGGDVREPDRERPPEAAALLPLPELDQAHARDRAQEEGRRLAAARPAGVARAVEGDGRVEAARPRRHAEPVHDEVAELPGAAARAPRPRPGPPPSRTPAPRRGTAWPRRSPRGRRPGRRRRRS